MNAKPENLLIVTHVLFKNGNLTEGPYSTVLRALNESFATTEVIYISLENFKEPVIYGAYKRESKFFVPRALGAFAPVKYLTDAFLVLVLTLRFLIKHRNGHNTIIGVDPLSALPIALISPIFSYKLIFYSVDYNEKRFDKLLMQRAYEFADKYSSKLSDKVWVVCETLKNHKESTYNVICAYVPNSFPFDSSYFEKDKNSRTFNKFVWTGSVLTDKQIHEIIKVCKDISQIKKNAEFVLVPINKVGRLKDEIAKQKLKNVEICEVIGQEASRQIVSKCDIGLAIYDKDFGSTKYIEPIKIWEYMMCGLPFIISCEPSTNVQAINESVAFLLDPGNELPKNAKNEGLREFKNFVDSENIKKTRKKALKIAKNYDARLIMKNSL